MKQFIKENLHTTLLLILTGLVLILWGRLIVAEFSHKAYTEHLTTSQSRVRCLAHFGWHADITSETEEKLYIPKEPDAMWKQYHALQKMSGFDLFPYCGKAVTKYTYRDISFPGEVFVSLLVSEGTAVGGHGISYETEMLLPFDIRSICQR